MIEMIARKIIRNMVNFSEQKKSQSDLRKFDFGVVTGKFSLKSRPPSHRSEISE
jgi:hypothetical protein